ncbi:MAG: DUF488 domain-containing protein [Actinobacteria bacterium]|nr:DUF488 domain-containing protein [Actinomycetota bacterium]
MTLLTVGHGTLGADELASLLDDAQVELLVDIRSYPGSRHNPQFGREAMAAWLPESGIAYEWQPALGGRRRPRPDSRNTALTNEAFRGYADYMETPEFADGVERLLERAHERRAAVMCSESVWWRCHRRLLSDAVLLLHQVPVEHLFHTGRLEPHHPLAEVRVESGRLVYDGGAPSLPGLGAG